jgi:hypothetical protein
MRAVNGLHDIHMASLAGTLGDLLIMGFNLQRLWETAKREGE